MTDHVTEHSTHSVTGSAAAALDVRRELAAPDLAERLVALGFGPEDVEPALRAASSVLTRPDDLAVVEEGARRLAARVGVLPHTDGSEVWQGLAVDADGVLAMLALLASAPAVAAFHASRDVPPEVSAATLADLGQQATVHRLVTGGFGVATYPWVGGHVWSGALYRLGRLQLDLDMAATVDGRGREWVLSTHIPRADRLAPEDVDASFAAAPEFFARHLPEVTPTDVHCLSWLLDPRLPRLMPGSNLASFQRRWRTYGEPRNGDDDALFFAFTRRGGLDLDRLPAQTSLQRALRSVWEAGEHWNVVEGRLA